MLFERKGISKKIDKNLLENLIILNKYYCHPTKIKSIIKSLLQLKSRGIFWIFKNTPLF